MTTTTEAPCRVHDIRHCTICLEGSQMRWHRDKSTGTYTAGPYEVRRDGDGWIASGPDLEETGTALKESAQAMCFVALIDRLGATNEHGGTCQAHLWDAVEVLDNHRKDRRGRVTLIIDNGGPNQQPIYTVRFNVGGGRTCIFRHEFKVIAP